MKTLKLCIVSLRSLPLFDEQYNSENVIGGAEINLYNLAVCFSRMNGIETRVLVDDFGQPAVLKKDNVELIRYGKAEKRGPVGKAAAVIARNLQLLTLDADVFIFTTAHPMLGKLVLLQKLLKGRKVIFRLSSDLNTDLEYYRKRNGLMSYLYYSFGLRHASAIVSQTEKQRNLLKEKLGLDSTIIPNGFIIKRNKDIIEKRHILWVGRCMATKRPLKFLELARQFPGEEFVMIMPINKEIPAGEFKERERLSAQICSEAKVLPNLKLLDYVTYNSIQDYFDRAKLYVCTSELEGFPNTFIQACLGGTPILSYNIDPDGMIDKYGLGCFCNDDGKKAAAFISGLNTELLSGYRNHALDYAARHNNINEIAAKYLALCRPKTYFTLKL